MISRTADVIKEKGKDGGKEQITVKAQYTLSQPGLLTPERRYYWHVRAMDEKGLWGPWSKTWSFSPRGPAYPLNVTLDYDPAKGTGILRWTANPTGRPPVKYRVYGSDEKGFTIMKDNQQVDGYFDIEQPRFAVERGPAWLKIDEKTGMLSGRPDMAGKAEVVVTARIEREVRKLDEKALVWGNEKVLSTTLERVGAATQKFIIDVQ